MKAEAQRAAVQSLLHYLTHFKLSHAVRKNLLLIESMKEMAKGGKRNVKPEEFVRVYDILLQVSGEANLLLFRARERERDSGGREEGEEREREGGEEESTHYLFVFLLLPAHR